MKKELFITAATLFTTSWSANAFAEISGTPEEAEKIRSAVETRDNDLNASNMWARVQQSTLKKSFSRSEAPALQHDFVSATERAEKCFPWAWEGGQRDRVAIATAAQVCLKSTLKPFTDLSQMGASVDAMNDNLLFLFNTQFELLRARAEAKMPMQGAPNVTANVSILGQQVWSESAQAPSLNWNQDFKILNFDKSRSIPFLIGPVPGSATLGARGTVNATFRAELNAGNGNLYVVPSTDLDGYAFGGVNMKVVKGGVEADLALLQSTFNLKAGVALAIDPTVFPPQLMYSAVASGHNSFSALDGKVDLVARTAFQIPTLGNEFRYSLVSYPGFEGSGFIFSETIEPTPVKF